MHPFLSLVFQQQSCGWITVSVRTFRKRFDSMKVKMHGFQDLDRMCFFFLGEKFLFYSISLKRNPL